MHQSRSSIELVSRQKQIAYMIMFQTSFTIIKTILSLCITQTSNPNNYLGLINLLLYCFLYRARPMTELKYEIISTSSCLMIMIINLQQDPLDIKQDTTYIMTYGIQIAMYTLLLESYKSQAIFLSLVYFFIYFRHQLWSEIGIYLVGLNMLNLYFVANLNTNTQNALKTRVSSNKEKLASLIRLLHRHIEQPLCILYQSQRTKQIKTLLLTQRFQNEYIKQDSENPSGSQCLRLLEAQHGQMFAQIIDEHFPLMPPLTCLKPLENSQTSKKENPGMVRNMSRSEVVFKSFQKYHSESRHISIAQDLESMLNSPNNQDAALFKRPKNAYAIQKNNTTTKSPTIRKKESDVDSRGYLDVVYEVQENTPFESAAERKTSVEYEELLPYECLWDGKKCLFLMTKNDKNRYATLQQKIQQLEQQHQYKDDMLATVAHDFKTPLNGMILTLEYLQNDSNHEEDKQLGYHLEIIRKSAFLLLYMINDIIDYSRISKNQINVSPQPFQLDQTINEVIELLNLQARMKGVEIIYLNNWGGDDMFSDPNRLKQILMNLLSNALKFTSNGKITVLVEEPTSREKFNLNNQGIMKNIIRVTVSDTGAGIPDEIKPKLFNMYATFDHNNGTNKHGAGMGLVISKKIVGLLGPQESIDLESQVGKGTSFSFLIFIYLQVERSRSIQSQTVRDIRFSSIYHREEYSGNHRKGKGQNSQPMMPPTGSLRHLNCDQLSRRTISQFRKMNTGHSSNPFYKVSDDNVHSHRAVDQEIQEDYHGDKAQNIQQQSNLIESQMQEMQLTRHGRQREQMLEKIPSIGQVHELDLNSRSVLPNEQNSIFNPRYQDDMLFHLLADQNDEVVQILVVDDEVFNVMAFKLMLKRFTKIVVDEAYDGNSAINMINQKKAKNEFYRCIFMDLTMGIMDGYQAGNIIRQLINNHTIQDAYLIALSGHDDEREKEKCLSIGFQGFLAKPVGLTDVLMIIDELNQMRQYYNI